MSSATMLSPLIIYREEQNFDWRVYLLFALVALTGWAVVGFIPFSYTTRSILIILIGFFPALIVVGLLRMTTEVTPTGIVVWFGWIPTYRRIVALDGIVRVEVVTYRPVRDYGGWGIRGNLGDDERVLNARGDRGVRIHLADGSRLLIGSQRPAELANAIMGGLRPGV